MISRERVLAALEHKLPDRVPLDFWVVPEIESKLIGIYGSKEAVLQHFNIDIRSFFPDFIGPKLRILEDGSWFDVLGCHRKKVDNGFSTYEEYAGAPLGFAESAEDIEKNYNYWPSPHWWDYSTLSGKIGEANKEYFIKLETGGLFEYAWALRGYEQYMMDMVICPEIPHYIMDKLTSYFCGVIEGCMKAAGDKYDLVYTYDDIAAQNSLLMSPEMWEEFVKPYHERLNATIKGFGKKVMYHSCGAVFPMIDKLVKLPIDVLNPLQPRAKDMDFEVIKNRWGSSLSFHGGIDIQLTLPRGSREDVRAEVRHAIDTLGKNGGYILTSAHYIQADTPLENIEGMYDEAIKYSKI